MIKIIFNTLFSNLKSRTLLRMSEPSSVAVSNSNHRNEAEKRSAEPLLSEEASPVKKIKKEPQKLQPSENKKRKIALLVSYNGKGYFGVQINKGFATIESKLFPALIKSGAWTAEHAETPSKMWFQRGSRTDKGVSASGQTFSLLAILVPDLIEKINQNLPDQIRAMGYIRTTKGFDSKNFCDSRTYMYMTPTFAFADVEQFITDDYRIDAKRVEHIRNVLKNFVGTHNFHNFTSGVKFKEKCANRYIIKFECSEPYIREGLEFVTIRVKGQSFMLHQIRKMIGLTMAIVKGYCGEPVIDQCWKEEKVDVPKAPGLGLVLEELHFSGYNKKFGKDGMHDPIDWTSHKEKVDEFKESQILSHIVTEEKNERVMFQWLRTLQFHNFGFVRPEGPQKPWYRAEVLRKDCPPTHPDDKTVDPTPEEQGKQVQTLTSNDGPTTLSDTNSVEQPTEEDKKELVQPLAINESSLKQENDKNVHNNVDVNSQIVDPNK